MKPTAKNQNKNRKVSPRPLAGEIAALAVFATIAAVQPARAAILNWDANFTGGATGGTGIWNTTDPRWFDGAANVLWNSTTPDAATLAGIAGTVTLGEAITAASLSFNTSGYIVDLNGFNLTVNGATSGSAAMSTTTITNSNATAATFSTGSFGSNSGPLLSGNLNVTYTGGAWTPAIAHTFTGTLSLLGTGTVRSDGTDIGANSVSSLTRLGGTTILQLGTAGNVATRTYNRSIELLTDTASIQTGGSKLLTLAGNISGIGKLRITSTQGGYVLSGNNTYSGTTDMIGAGTTLIAASNTAFGNSPTVNVAVSAGIGFQGNVTIGSTTAISLTGANPAWGFGSIQNFSGNNTFGGSITNGSNVTRLYGADTGSTLTLTGVVGGGKGLQKIGQGTIVLTNKDTYGTANAGTGNETAVNDGILRLDFSQATWETTPGVLTNIVNNGVSTDSTSNSLSQLWLGGGTLKIVGKSGAVVTQNFKNHNGAGAPTLTGTAAINLGASAVRVVQNGATTVNVGIGKLFEANRAVGGTVDFTLPTSGTILIQNTGVGGGSAAIGTANTILTGNGAAFATVGGTDWAALGASRDVVAGGFSIIGFYTANTADTLAGNADVSSGGDTALIADATLTSLRFNNAGARTITATGFALTTGGILVTPAVGNNVTTISGGTLRGNISATGNLQDLVVFQNNTANKLVIGSVISNASNALATGLTKTGNGTLELTGANTYTGTTVVTGGLLKLSNASAIPGGIDATVGANESALTIKGGVIGLTAASGDFTRALGTGAGQVQLTGNAGFAAYGGDRTVNFGGAAAAHGWGSTGTLTGLRTMSTLILGAPDSDSTIIFANPLTMQGTNTNTVPTSRTIQVENGSAAIDARLTGVMSGNEIGFTKTGAGTLEMTAINTHYGPTNINGGTLFLTGTLSTDTPIFVNNGAILRQGANGVTNGHVITLTSGIVDLNGFNETAKTLTLGGGAALTTSIVQSGAGTLSIAGNVTYNGNVANDGGTLISGLVDLGSTVKTFAVNNSTAAANDLLITADIFSSGVGGIAKIGLGTLNLIGNNTYFGPTTVSAGRLIVSGSIGGGTVNVQNGAILGGSGTLNGALFVESGGILAPGTSAGTLELNSPFVSFAANSTLALEITGASPGDGSGFYDQVNITNGSSLISLDSNALISLSLSGFTPQASDKFFVLTRADFGSFSANFVNALEGATVSLGGGYSGTITYLADSLSGETFGGNDIAIYNVVPEPASASALFAGLGSLLGLQRFRRRNS